MTARRFQIIVGFIGLFLVIAFDNNIAVAAGIVMILFALFVDEF